MLNQLYLVNNYLSTLPFPTFFVCCFKETISWCLIFVILRQPNLASTSKNKKGFSKIILIVYFFWSIFQKTRHCLDYFTSFDAQSYKRKKRNISCKNSFILFTSFLSTKEDYSISITHEMAFNILEIPSISRKNI